MYLQMISCRAVYFIRARVEQPDMTCQFVSLCCLHAQHILSSLVLLTCFVDVIGGDGIFLNGAYCNFCCSFTVKYEVFYTKRAIRDFFVNDQELSM